MHYAVLCIGSNVADALDKIAGALELLVAQTQGQILRSSSLYPSGGGYLNQVALFASDDDYQSLHAATKRVEGAMGRTPQMKEQNLVPVDIDIVIYDGAMIRPADYKAAFFRQGYREVVFR